MALDFPDAPADQEQYEGFVYSSATGAWRVRRDPAVALQTFDYLVIGGGGGAGQGGSLNISSGGGAGGYQCSVTGENSGGGFPAAPKLLLASGNSLTVSIGAGCTTPGYVGTPGTSSYLGAIYGLGGGAGAYQDDRKGGLGGSGGGAANNSSSFGPGVVGQGFNSAFALSGTQGCGGGGASGTPVTVRNGGPGVTSSITGSAVGRAGGGAGNYPGTGTATDGGGNTYTSGTVNTGGGCGGGTIGRNGGSGIVILKYPDTITLTIGPGLTSSTTSAGGFKVTEFTAGEDTVSY